MRPFLGSLALVSTAGTRDARAPGVHGAHGDDTGQRDAANRSRTITGTRAAVGTGDRRDAHDGDTSGTMRPKKTVTAANRPPYRCSRLAFGGIARSRHDQQNSPSHSHSTKGHRGSGPLRGPSRSHSRVDNRAQCPDQSAEISRSASAAPSHSRIEYADIILLRFRYAVGVSENSSPSRLTYTP